MTKLLLLLFRFVFMHKQLASNRELHSSKQKKTSEEHYLHVRL